MAIGRLLRENGLKNSVKFETVKAKKSNKKEDVFYDRYSPYRVEIHLNSADFSKLPDIKFLD